MPRPVSNAELVSILEDTKEALHIFGWVRGTVGNTEKGFCLLGAIDHVCQKLSLGARTRIHCINTLAQTIYDRTGDRFDDDSLVACSEFNDKYATNVDSLYDLIDDICEELRQHSDPEERERCPRCNCRSYARVDEKQPDGSFGPGPEVRCVNCKHVWKLP